jgi:hypothetical protein
MTSVFKFFLFREIEGVGLMRSDVFTGLEFINENNYNT